MDERGGDRRIDAAAQTEQDAAVANRLPDLTDRAVDEVLGGPVRAATADVDQEVAQEVPAQRRVGDLGVELDAVAATVAHAGDRGIRRAGDAGEAGRQPRDVVAVTHPDIERWRADPGRAATVA